VLGQRPDKVAGNGSLGYFAAVAVGHDDVEYGKVLPKLHELGLGAKIFPRSRGKVGNGALRRYAVDAEILAGRRKSHIRKGEVSAAVGFAHLVLMALLQRHAHYAAPILTAGFLHYAEHGGESVFLENRFVHISSHKGTFLFEDSTIREPPLADKRLIFAEGAKNLRKSASRPGKYGRAALLSLDSLGRRVYRFWIHFL
jgi:hypothetical protein